MSEPLVIEPPNFNPEEDDDVEYFCLRAPAHLDVTDVLNGVTLNIDTNILEPSSAGHSNEIISTFKAKSDGQEYALTFADGKELEGIRLLVPDYDDEEQLVPFKPFKGQFNLTSVVGEAGSDGSGNVQSDLLLAPAAERAPKPAFELSGNGAVDKMRLAYIPVAQKEGLKRRWEMPGSTAFPPQPVKQEEEAPKRSSKKAKKSKR